MQISTSQLYDRSAALMQKLSQRADKLQIQVSSEVRLSAPSDDVVAYQRLATLKQGKADDAATSGNVSLAKSLLQQSDTTLTSVETGLQRAAELVLQANNGTLTDANRATIANTSLVPPAVAIPPNTRAAVSVAMIDWSSPIGMVGGVPVPAKLTDPSAFTVTALSPVAAPNRGWPRASVVLARLTRSSMTPFS